jgi:uncharacterized protein (DUF433 family)
LTIAISKRTCSLWRALVVGGTRIRVATILSAYRLGMTVEEIVQQYPTLQPADVHDALAFAYDPLAEIDAVLAADDETVAKTRLSGRELCEK